MQTAMWFWLLFTACTPSFLQDDGDPRNCPVRTAWYPDADGDGIGEPTDVWFACEQPADGWVTSVGPSGGTPPPTRASGGSGGSGASGGSGGSGGSGSGGSGGSGSR